MQLENWHHFSNLSDNFGLTRSGIGDPQLNLSWAWGLQKVTSLSRHQSRVWIHYVSAIRGGLRSFLFCSTDIEWETYRANLGTAVLCSKASTVLSEWTEPNTIVWAPYSFIALEVNKYIVYCTVCTLYRNVYILYIQYNILCSSVCPLVVQSHTTHDGAVNPLTPRRYTVLNGHFVLDLR
jgi:hypothetical protein